MFGTLTLGGGSPYPYNSALLLDQNSAIRGHFDKNILMVFGEYIPFYEQMGWLHKLIPETSNFARGTDVEVLPLERASGTVNLGPMICYEDIFPRSAAASSTKIPTCSSTSPMTPGSAAPPSRIEHMALSVYRTIETRLDLVRAVNTGVSAFIDSTGRVVWQGPAVDPDEAPPPPYTNIAEAAVQTPQKLYAQMGEWFGSLCLILTTLLGRSRLRESGALIRWRVVALGRGAERRARASSASLSGHPLLALELLAHLGHVHAGAQLAFSTRSCGCFPRATLGCIAAGIVRHPRRARAARPLEAAAVLLVLAGPALTAGSLEGEQAGLVISVMIGILVALAAGRRVLRKLAPAAP